MNKTRISKAYRGDAHIGWKKTVAGRNWFLWYGTTPSDEAKAILIATALEAKWQLAKLGGGSELTETDFEDAKDLAMGGSPRTGVIALLTPKLPSPELASIAPINQTPVNPEAGVRRWLYPSIDEFVAGVMKTLKPDLSNADHVANTRDRINRARDAREDMPLDSMGRKELDDWLLDIRNTLKSKCDGKPLGAATIRNLAGAVRAALTKFVEWEWWTPPPLWENAFKGYTIKKLQTTAEKKRKKKRPPAHSVAEKRILWHLAADFQKAMMALADWAGHTQKEAATLIFDEIKEENGEMFIDRDRNKTGVPGRWWIPPQAAVVVRRVVARTPRDPLINPNSLAFLTPRNRPLVHRAATASLSKSDYVGDQWDCLLRAAKPYGVRHISYKFMRKGTAQIIRDQYDKEVSRSFLAQADQDIQDEAYTRACLKKVEKAMRAIYPQMESLFEPIRAHEWQVLKDAIEQQNGIAPVDPSVAA